MSLITIYLDPIPHQLTVAQQRIPRHAEAIIHIRLTLPRGWIDNGMARTFMEPKDLKVLLVRYKVNMVAEGESEALSC